MKIGKMIVGYTIVCMKYNTKLDPLDLITLCSTFIKIFFLAEIIKKFSAFTMILDTIFLRVFFISASTLLE